MITVFGNEIGQKEIEKIKIITPEKAGKVWKGVPHGNLIKGLKKEFEYRGWEVLTEKFSIARGGADLVGAFDLIIPEIKAPEGQNFSLGFYNSNSMRLPLKIVTGSTIRVCTNGMVSGEILLCRKHTKKFNLLDSLEDSLDKYSEESKKLIELTEKFKETPLKGEQIDFLLCETGRNGILPWSHIGEVDKEYNHPTFSEHGKGTLWALFNAFTYIVKKSPPILQMERINGFRELCLHISA